MKTYITQSGLARRLNVCSATLNNWLETHGVEPDGVLLQGQRKNESLLFDIQRLPELQRAIAGNGQAREQFPDDTAEETQ